jgi:hypothetical protein
MVEFNCASRFPTGCCCRQRHEPMVELDGVSRFPAVESGAPRDGGREPREARQWLVWLAMNWAGDNVE